MKMYIMLSIIFCSANAYSECVEYKIVDHGDRVEAVCVGAPVTAKERAKLEQERRQEESNIQRQKSQRKNNVEYRLDVIEEELNKKTVVKKSGRERPVSESSENISSHLDRAMRLDKLTPAERREAERKILKFGK